MNWQHKEKHAWGKWINTHQWDVFGTLCFSSFRHIGKADRDDVCGKVWRSYFNSLDRAIYGKQKSIQSRFNRVVFVQYGTNNDNPHVHFLAKSPIAKEEFCIQLNAIWSSMFEVSAQPATNEITPIIRQSGTTGYGLHEFYRQDSNTIDLRLSNTIEPAQHVCVRDDAAFRLKQMATEKNNLAAKNAFPRHIQAVEARIGKRER